MNAFIKTVCSVIAAIGLVLGLAVPAQPTQVASFDSTTLPACQEEDGSDWMCYWDAANDSNGLGDSFWVDGFGNVIYL